MHPDFIIIGAPRSGTTSLWEALRANPNLFCTSLKEPWYWAIDANLGQFTGPGDDQGIRSSERYRELFIDARENQLSGEASTLYLHSPLAPHRIKAANPDVKLIAILREPADRAYSNYVQHRLQRRESMACFGDAIDQEDIRRLSGWSPFWQYRNMGFYGEQLSRYYSIFPERHIKVVKFEDLIQNFVHVFSELCDFLGVENTRTKRSSISANKSGMTRSVIARTVLEFEWPGKQLIKGVIGENSAHRIAQFLKNSNLKSTSVPTEILRRLRVEYRDDLLIAQRLTGLDLTDWIVR